MVSCAATRLDFSGIEKQGHADDTQSNFVVKHGLSRWSAFPVFDVLLFAGLNTDDTFKDHTEMCLGDCFCAQRHMSRVSAVF
jgi:hypothetical protein